MPTISLIELHQAAAHFPMALLMSSAFFEAMGTALKKQELRTTSYWIHLLGLAGGFVTLALGLLGNPFIEDMGWVGNPLGDYDQIMVVRAVRHQWLGIVSLVIFTALAMFRVKHRDSFSKPKAVLYWLVTVAGVVVLGITGYLGGHVMD